MFSLVRKISFFARFIAIGAAFAMVIANSHAAEISFEEVTISAGVSSVGPSWGSAWGDFNSDGWPDLWASNHGRAPSLYLNMRDGTFYDIASQVLSSEIWAFIDNAALPYDAHGAAWADFDNDGDQDLIQLADGGVRRHPNHLYVNSYGVQFEMQEQAATLGLDIPNANSRTPFWFDWNNDGLLDLIMTATIRSGSGNPSVKLFQQQADGGFSDTTNSVGLDVTTSTRFALLSDLTGDGERDVAISELDAPLRVFSISETGFTDETASLGLLGIGNSAPQKNLWAVSGTGKAPSA